MEFIYEAEDAFSADFCDRVIDCFEKSSHKKPGEVLKNRSTGGDGDVNDSIKKTMDVSTIHVTDEPMWRELVDRVCNTCLEHVKLYYEKIRDENVNMSVKDGHHISKNLASRIFFENLTFPQVQKYEKGDYFKWHDDYSRNKILSFLIYLNTLEEGDGGETEFLYGKTIRPKKGKIVIFPATWNYIHRGREVIKNSKYIISMFGLTETV